MNAMIKLMTVPRTALTPKALMIAVAMRDTRPMMVATPVMVRCTCLSILFVVSIIHYSFASSDIDECDLEPCPGNSICTNTPGSYLCSCPLGYTLKDGYGCVGTV